MANHSDLCCTNLLRNSVIKIKNGWNGHRAGGNNCFVTGNPESYGYLRISEYFIKKSKDKKV
jgi:hypothetical protein